MKAPTLRQILKSLTVFALAVLALSPLTASAADSVRNEKLLAAREPFEVLTETALTGDAAKVAQAYKTAQSNRASARALLSEANVTRFDEVFGLLEAANTKKDYIGESLQAAELYKLVVLSLDTKMLTAPTQEVNLMDYIGFRITALLQAPSPDWTAIAATTKEAGGYWAAIRSRVGDAKLQGKMDEAQKGLANGSGKQDASLTRESAKNNLDLVDELESYFAKK